MNPTSPTHSFRMSAEIPPQDAFLQVLHHELDYLHACVRLLNKDFDHQVHELRKGTKRLRAMLTLVRKTLEPSEYRSSMILLRDLNRRLGGARESFINLQTFTELQDPEILKRAKALQKELDTTYTRKRDELLENITLRDDLQAALQQLREWSGQWELRTNLDGVFLKSLRRSYRRSRKLHKQLVQNSDPDLLHEWRKEVKQLWYHLRLLNLRLGPASDTPLAQVDELGSLLGFLHDLHTLTQGLDSACRKLNVPSTDCGKLTHKPRKQTLSQTRDLAEDLFRAKPSEFIQRLND